MNVTYETIAPVKRDPRGNKSRLTRLQEIELWSWYLAKKQLGTIKSKARELGVTEDSIWRALQCIKARKGKQ